MPVWLQVAFFGALLAAIMSTASATLLAPSTTFVENVLKNFVKMNDKHELLYMRLTVVVFTACVLGLFDHHDRHADLRAGIEGVSVSGGRCVLAAGVRAVLAALDDARARSGRSSSAWARGRCSNLRRSGKQFPPVLGGFLMAAIGMFGGSLLSAAEPRVQSAA